VESAEEDSARVGEERRVAYPQRLKPELVGVTSGTTEVVPFPNSHSLRSFALLEGMRFRKSCPFQSLVLPTCVLPDFVIASRRWARTPTGLPPGRRRCYFRPSTRYKSASILW
jgi:hypothetical protein